MSLKHVFAYFNPEQYPELIRALNLDISRMERARTRGVRGSLISLVEPEEQKNQTGVNPPLADIPLDHIVLLKLKPFESTEAENHLYRCMARLDTIPGVSNLRFGPIRCDLYPDMTDRTGGYTHILAMTFTNGAALKRYDIHPLHMHTKMDVIAPNSAAPSNAVDIFSLLPRL